MHVGLHRVIQLAEFKHLTLFSEMDTRHGNMHKTQQELGDETIASCSYQWEVICGLNWKDRVFDQCKTADGPHARRCTTPWGHRYLTGGQQAPPSSISTLFEKDYSSARSLSSMPSGVKEMLQFFQLLWSKCCQPVAAQSVVWHRSLSQNITVHVHREHWVRLLRNST